MKRIILSIIVAGIWGLCFCASPAQAEPITIAIEAEVDFVEDRAGYLEGKIKVGNTITGSYIYDSSVTRLPGHRYEFHSPPSGVFLSVDGFEFKTDPSNVDFEIGIGNDLSWGDTYFFISFNNLPLSNDASVDDILWSLKDPTGNVLSSDALSATAPILEDWQQNFLRLEGERSGYIVDAHVTSAIPEPATMILLSLGLLILRARTIENR